MEYENKIFTLADVSLHNQIKDCWVIIDAKVYDVTRFLNDHPGGDEVMLAAAGKNASKEFEDAGHGSVARLMLDEFYVEEIDPSETPKETTLKMLPEQARNPETTTTLEMHSEKEHKQSGFIIKVLGFLVPLAILRFVVGIGFFK